MFRKEDMRKYYCYHPVLTDEYFRGKPLEIGLGTQLFMGETMVEDAYQVKQVQEHPEMDSLTPFLEAEYPWENTEYPGLLAQGPLYDEDEDLFKIWYLCLGYFENGKYSPFKDLANGIAPGYLCYAESKDGEHWVKPITNEHPIGKIKENNIVFTGTENGFTGGRIFLNPDKTDKEKKYLMLYSAASINLAYSPDGRHWYDVPGVNPVIPMPFDTDNHIMYDDKRHIYQLITRPAIFAKNENTAQEMNDPNGNYRRSVCVSESTDLIHWSTIRKVTGAPEGAYEDQLDHQNTFAIGGTLLTCMNRFACKDPFDWDHQMHHQYWSFGPAINKMKFIDSDEMIPGARIGNYELELPHFKAFPLYKDDKTFFVMLQPIYNEKYGRMMIAANYLHFGENRFIGRYADAYGGWLLTREFFMRGTGIELNCDVAKDGEILAEIVTAEGGNVREGVYHAGFRRGEFDAIRVGGYHTRLTWGGNGDLSCFTGKAIYIRFYLKNAKVFSMDVIE